MVRNDSNLKPGTEYGASGPPTPKDPANQGKASASGLFSQKKAGKNASLFRVFKQWGTNVANKAQ
jgi:hypothetical protein